ncbi:MAG: DUF488 domain-containing protein [Dehalococcoidia bacterium]|nr:DUF488 domain-containing protein [Dehalococcoidia bacterium]
MGIAIATIGFTKTSAEHFFERLRAAGVERLVDIRLHPESQLAGFAKGSDLPYLLDRIAGITYEYEEQFAPTEAILNGYRKEKRPPEWFEEQIGQLYAERGIPDSVARDPFAQGKTVLLCSEASAEHCHRRILAELLCGAWGADITHL